MSEILKKMERADVIVLASPMYFFTWSGLMKRFLDRTLPLTANLWNTDFYLITTGGVTDMRLFDNILSDFDKYTFCFDIDGSHGNRNAGYIAAIGARPEGKGIFKNEYVLEAAYEAGLNIKKSRKKWETTWQQYN